MAFCCNYRASDSFCFWSNRKSLYKLNIIVRPQIFTIIILVLIALISFLGLLSELAKKYGVERPAFGGTLREGIIGNPRFINPLLTQTDADRDLTALVFAGLMRLDENGAVAPALAEKYEISENGLVYTVTLKNGLMWSDGSALTSEDIVFTVNLAKNPVARSPRRANWEGVEAEAVDKKTIKFRLRKIYAPFLENLTLGILSKHLWENIPPSQISFAELNLNPVGAGPFKISSISRDGQGSISSINLKANKYYALGEPFIRNIKFYFYQDEERALRNLQTGFLDSLGSISPKNIEKLAGKNLNINKIALRRIIAVFLNQNANKDLASENLRKALNLAVDKKKIVEEILGGYGKIIDGPFPKETSETAYDAEAAKNLIAKQKSEIKFTLTTIDAPELVEIAELVKKMWNSAGLNVDIKTFPVNELEENVIGPRKYDAFLYGEELIGAIPDPFAFWHSSQRLYPGYNIAIYTNSKVDKLLESVRAQQNESEREKIYREIELEIKKDMPAIFLYSPDYIYALPKKLAGNNSKTMNNGSDRFAQVHKWYLSKSYIWKIFLK